MTERDRISYELMKLLEYKQKGGQNKDILDKIEVLQDKLQKFGPRQETKC